MVIRESHSCGGNDNGKSTRSIRKPTKVFPEDNVQESSGSIVLDQ